ncbi:MAG TPA: type IV-A pilus assembly ATPase PilB [Candidatus Nitrosotenuis sp.]|jgi:type IV pilus assembly protein PilB|nr:type IV-A pilus assembly ATPase PilB [Candidatus Nitrosotenuis sp.]
MITKSPEELGKLLVEEGFLTARQLEKALAEAARKGEPLNKVVVAMGFVTEKDITESYGKQMGVHFVDLDNMELDPELAKSIPEHLAQRYKVIPVAQRDNRLTLAMVDPLNVLAIDDIRLITGFEIDPVIATEESITRCISRQFGTTDLVEVEDQVKELSATDFGGSLEVDDDIEEEIALDKLKELVDEAPIVRVVNLIISQAINDKASDIHIEPEAKSVRVRYRVDGVLHDVMSPPKHIQAPMVSRIKIMASMDIAERRVPQDGKIHLRHDNREFDLRVSTVPTVHGEKVVMRILDKSAVQLGLNKLGFYEEIQRNLEEIVEKPYGMILVTGPTGSGKSTTLYSCLNKLNRGHTNIMTIEDPVEYQIAGINQVQVNPKANLTFASALRAFLRQDPDIIMVGEIRDHETAKIAVESALTGHLVLSTLHTNDAPGAISRLIEMGVEPFLVASSVIGVLAQRLARTICPNCKEAYVPAPEAIKRFGLAMFSDSDISFYRGRGCDHCKMTGYRGRTGIHELMPMGDRVRSLILQRASTSEIRQAAIEEGMKTMQDDGLRKVLDGITSMEEVLRVVFVEGADT